MCRKAVLLVGLYCGLLFCLFGQTVPFRYLLKKDGLSQSSVFSIAQDGAGFMWFGTRDGLNKFDGYKFKIYRHSDDPNSLIGNDIRTLFADTTRKELWVGTVSGLSCYHALTDNFTNYFHLNNDSTSLTGNVIRQVYRDSKDRLWIGTSMGLNLLGEDRKTIQRFYLSDNSLLSTGGNDIEVIFEDSRGHLIFGTDAGLYILSDAASPSSKYPFKRLLLPPSAWPDDVHIKSIVEDEAGNLWLGSLKDGVAYWDRTTDQLAIYRKEGSDDDVLSNNEVRAMCLDRKGDLWVGTFAGLNQLKKGEKEFIQYHKNVHRNDGLSDKSIRSLFVDDRGSLWIGSYYGGINHFDENHNRFINFTRGASGTGLTGDVVSSFAEDEDGNFWIGTEGGGLNFYDRNTGQFSSYQANTGQSSTLSGNNVKQLLLDNDQLWIGTFQAGLNLFNTEKKTFRHYRHQPDNPNSLANDNVYGLNKKGKYLWILTYGGGLDILDLEQSRFHHFVHKSRDEQSLSSDLTRVFLETSTGQIWIGTERGINKVELGTDGLPVAFTNFLPEERIYTLQEDRQGNIWIGTISNGLYCFSASGEQLLYFTVEDGLPGNTIFGALEDASGDLWISTNNGLSRYNPRQQTFTNYSYSNGLENVEYNFNAYYKASTGELLFGGVNGFTLFNPAHVLPNEYIPPLVFTQLKKDNKAVHPLAPDGYLDRSINETSRLVFNYNEANFSLCFAALDYLSPENNSYAYKMEGLDQAWQYSVGETEAAYTIQREGTYSFRVRGGNSEGLWNPTERQIEIVVLPPPWRSNTAFVLYILLLAALFYGLLRFIRLRHKLELQRVAREQQEELTEMKLRFFTNITHEFRTPLTLILGPLQHLLAKEKHPDHVHQQLSLIERNTQRLLNLVNQVLSFRKLVTDHEQMKVVQSDFVHFLHEIFLPFQETAKLRQITYLFSASSPSLKIWFDQDKMEKVFFNLLSNAFKFTPVGGSICVDIQEHASHLEIVVQDSGPGVSPDLRDEIFKRFYEKGGQVRSAIKSSGIGLAISKQMVELHHGKIFVTTAVGTNRKEKTGAKFVVELPKGSGHFKEEEIVSNYSDEEKASDYQSAVVPQLTAAAPSTEEPTTKAPADAPLLLIVEDNAEVSAYIQQVFTGSYRIITAGNGVEALAMAKKHSPDLVISDVMMPEMDGITFCSQLKTDIEISHIPVVLLTARAASLFKIEGLKTGADDYVTKPFHPEELVLRVHNIIKARREAREKFTRVFNLDPKQVTVTSADEDFLKRALQFVEDNMDNTDLSVEVFAREMAVSRPLLFIKIKALTNQTPNNFIKRIRMKRAAQLLEQDKLRITEVAYAVGFQNPRYFSKCFQKEYGQTPSDYADSIG